MSQVVQEPQDIVRQLLAGTGDLPVLPQMASRILDELHSPRVTALRIAEFVKKDPVVATAVLRVANSALYGGRTEITDLAFAMTRIGLNQVRNLVLALVLRSSMVDPHVYGSVGSWLMDHSLGVAFGSRMLADTVGLPGEETFLCGLLHDMGRLALTKALREAYGIHKTGELPREVEALVDQHHGEAGALLVHKWGLPEMVEAVARWHHFPEQAGEHLRVAAAVSFADAMAHRLGLGKPPDERFNLVSHPAGALLGLKVEQVEEMAMHLPGLFQTARAALN
ncbi:MAG: HDOD domain-containing protein [Acidobacteria bacterium]|nr:HDOD domain-containing protein [Acidobacteriota bacterium]